MKTLFPHPILSAALALSWIALTELSPAHLALALAAAAAIPLVIAPYLEGLPALRALPAAARLALLVTWDVVLANATVARLVLGPLPRLRPAFLRVPLSVTHPHAIALLASIVSITPGTVSVGIAPDARTLLVHALDTDDPQALVARIKERYERPLMEILEC